MSDLISRESAIIQISWDFPNLEVPKIKDSLDKLPSAEKTGHWIRRSDKGYPIEQVYYECSECGCHSIRETDFCMDCGADMRGAENDKRRNYQKSQIHDRKAQE